MATISYDVWVFNAQGQRVRETRTETVPDAQIAAAANAVTLRDRAAQALALNATYLAIGAPNTTQVTAQVRRLTQECSALIRLLVGALDSTDGT